MMEKLGWKTLGVCCICLTGAMLAGPVQAKVQVRNMNDAIIENCTLSKVDLVASSASVMNGQKEVRIGYETREEMNGVCDLTLHTLAYDEQNSSLTLSVKSEEPCLNDAYGKRTGVTGWRLPDSLIRKSGTLDVVINGVKAGVISVNNGEAHLIPENPTF